MQPWREGDEEKYCSPHNAIRRAELFEENAGSRARNALKSRSLAV